MDIDLSEAIQLLRQERGLSDELIRKTIEETLLAAYKKRFGTDENAMVRFDEGSRVSLLSKKKVVEHEDVYNPVDEIDLHEARELHADAEVGDEMLVPVDPAEFSRQSVMLAKQTARQSIREIQKDSLFAEYKEKKGEIVVGYYQRERNGDIFVDLGKIEARLPRRFQSNRETYHLNDRIKSIVKEVEKTPTGLQITLSRTDPEFVRAIFESEVPEVYDKTVEIYKVVREAGARTKLAVFSNRDDVDPVGACVGLKGIRIHAVIKELEGEKIDVLKYDPDPARFIKNALSPAEVREVIILNEKSKKALAVVSDSVLSLAIGKQGLNVRLANKLTDWLIDVKTESQFAEMDIAAESRRAVSELFGDPDEEFSRISELPGVDAEVAQALLDEGVEFIVDFLDLPPERLAGLAETGRVSEEQIAALRAIIDESVEILDEDDEGEAAEGDELPPEEDIVEEVECPECGAGFALDAEDSSGTIKCPSCGAELELSYDSDEESDSEESDGDDLADANAEDEDGNEGEQGE